MTVYIKMHLFLYTVFDNLTNMDSDSPFTILIFYFFTMILPDNTNHSSNHLLHHLYGACAYGVCPYAPFFYGFYGLYGP